MRVVVCCLSAARVVLALLCLVAVRTPCFAQTEGQAALKRFEEWKRQPANADLGFGQALTNYRKQLVAQGASDAAADRTIRLIVAYDEATLYNHEKNEHEISVPRTV